MNFLIPIICGIMYRMGGSDNPYLGVKFFNYRAMIGIFVGTYFTLTLHSWIPLICILTYWFQPPYGDKSYLNFLGEWGKFAFVGFIFGVSSTPIWVAAGMWWMGLVQGAVSAIVYTIVRYLDEKNIIKNPWVEFLRGVGGTSLLWMP